MVQLLEFIGNHPLLVGSLVALLTALAFTEMRRGGQGITSAQLTQLVNQQGAIVVDVREKADYSKGHIVDSISMPFSKAQERAGELSKPSGRLMPTPEPAIRLFGFSAAYP